MSEDARIFLVTGIIALIFMVIVPLVARTKRYNPTTEHPEAQEGAGPAAKGADVAPHGKPHSGGGKKAA